MTAVGARVTGAQTGSLLAFLATKVLGQYELFPPYGETADARPGRLLLVAPNIVAAEQELDVDPRDFRLWVCLHEETHRVQFGAVPWLREHVMTEIRAFVEETDLDSAAVLRRLRAAAGAAYDAVRGGTESEGGSLIEVVQTPAQREILDRITALMSLLEGHADYVMDGVGPDRDPVGRRDPREVPAPPQGGHPARAGRATAARDRRQAAAVPRRRALRPRCRRADRHGHLQRGCGNDPRTCPTKAELADPDAWVKRVVTPRQLPA